MVRLLWFSSTSFHRTRYVFSEAEEKQHDKMLSDFTKVNMQSELSKTDRIAGRHAKVLKQVFTGISKPLEGCFLT